MPAVAGRREDQTCALASKRLPSTSTTSPKRRFLGLPLTKVGWLAVWLSLLFVLLFILVTTTPFHLPGMLIMGLGIIATIHVLLAIIWKRGRSWLVWLALIPGVIALLLSAGDLLSPH